MKRAAALLYAHDGYSTASGMLGRRVAGEEFLRGLLRHGDLGRIVGLVGSNGEAAAFRAQMADLAPQVEPVIASLEAPAAVGQAGTLFLPGPGLQPHAWWRRRVGDQRAFSLCGITHTTATDRAMEGLADLLIAPVQPWDALICTSRAVHDMVRRVIEEHIHYLNARLGATRFGVPALPVIPLGVDCAAFARDPAAGAALRARLGIAEEDVAVLVMARLSLPTKFSPLPLYLALQRAAKRARTRMHLLLAGWFDSNLSRRAYVDAATEACPDVTLHVLDGQDAAIRRGAWSGADIFTLPVDNVQETYGLAPVEAMAAGMPVVVTDWDGFRDTVEDGVCGFRVPTAMTGQGARLALRYQAGADDYGAYLLGISQSTAMDVEAAATAFARLAADPALRRSMGDAGRRRALGLYDWSAIIPQYLRLWDELARLRGAGQERAVPQPGRERVPVRPDPFRLFAAYPTALLGLETRLDLAPDADPAALPAIAAIPGAITRGFLLPELPVLAATLATLAQGPATIAALAASAPAAARPLMPAGLAWLMKMGLVRIAPPEHDPPAA